MITRKYKRILLFIPMACLGSQGEEQALSDDETDKYCENFKEKLGIDEKKYSVDKGMAWIIDKGYKKLAKPALRSMPWIGKFFDNSEEQLEVAQKSYKKLKSLSKEFMRGAEHMRNIYGVYEKGERIKKTLAKAWKKSEIAPLLLDMTRELTGIDLNPDLYLRGLPFADSFRHKWRNLTRETELTERLKAFQQISEHEMKWFATNLRIDSLMKSLPLLKSKSEILLKEIKALKEEINANKSWFYKDKDIAKAKSLYEQLANKLKAFKETQEEERKTLNKLAELKADVSNLKKESSMNTLKAKMLKKQRDQLRKRAGIRTAYEVERDGRSISRSRRGVNF